MKKVLLIFSIVFVVFCISSTNAISQSFVWAEKSPIDGLLTDHTYFCIARAYCPTSRYSYYGSNSGGSYLNGTFGITDNTGDSRSRCIACYNNISCKVRYLSEGVCHQDTNRALYPVGLGRLTVRNARGADISEWKYGTYGKYTWRWAKCKQECWFGEPGW